MMIEFGELKFEEIIGRGHFAVVHKGVWKGREVALKCITLPDNCLFSIPPEVEILK